MKVTFQIEGGSPVVIECNAGENLLELARRANVAIDAPCSGNGSCGKCRVKLVEGTVENSILSRGVRVQKGAVVRNAVIMQDGYIMSGAHVECCILDKQVIVREGSTLTAPATYPLVVAKNTIV